jgi:hypothetical protein
MYSFLLAIGLLFFGTGTFVLYERVHFIKNGMVAVATVVDMNKREDSDGDMVYAPVFQFITHNNEKIIYQYSIASYPPDWSIGEKTKVVYQKDLPHEVVLLTYFGSFGVAVILLSIALACLSISIGYYWSRKFFNSLQ